MPARYGSQAGVVRVCTILLDQLTTVRALLGRARAANAALPLHGGWELLQRRSPLQLPR